MVLGCSLTLGIGIALEDTWSYKVAKKLNLHLANLAIGGSSCDTSFRICYEYIDKIKPKIVIILPPHQSRCELFLDDDEVFSFGPWLDWKYPLALYYKTWITAEPNSRYQKLKNILALDKLCSDRNIKFYNIENNQQMSNLDMDNFGRDLLHPGTYWNSKLASFVIDDLA